jgi:hypothetical protein
MSQLEIKSMKVRGLFEWFDKRSLAIPEIQREFVWNAKRACALLDSIYRGFPVGTIMIWRTDRKRETMLRHVLHVLPTFDSVSNKEILFLLDGQQRLSVLHNVREGSSVKPEKGRPIHFANIFFSLDDDDECRFFHLKKHDPERHFRVTDLLKGICKPQAVRKRNAVNDCRMKLLQYEIPVVFTTTAQVEHVRQSFIRINSQGMRITEADKAFSQAQRVRPLDRFHNLRSRMSDGFKDLTKETYWSTLILARGYRSLGQKSMIRLSRDIEKTDDGMNWFLKEEPLLAKSITRACDYLKSKFGVRSLDLLPSENIIPVLAMFFYAGKALPSRKQALQVRQWFWHVSVAQRYVGAAYERHILDDVDFFSELAAGKNRIYRIERRIPMHKLKLGIYNSGGALPKAYRLLLISMHPRFLANGDAIDFDDVSAEGNRKQLHHIFPRALLRNAGVPKEQWNLIGNICYLAAGENKSVGSGAPIDYLEPYNRKRNFASIMKSHLIPHARTSPLWATDIKKSYKLFVDLRCNMIARAFAEAAGVKLFE